MTLSCIVCGKVLENAVEGVKNQPNDGLAFRSYGHYGSAVFDPVDNNKTFLEVNVCDNCLIEAQKVDRVRGGRMEARYLKPGDLIEG